MNFAAIFLIVRDLQKAEVTGLLENQICYPQMVLAFNSTYGLSHVLALEKAHLVINGAAAVFILMSLKIKIIKNLTHTLFSLRMRKIHANNNEEQFVKGFGRNLGMDSTYTKYRTLRFKTKKTSLPSIKISLTFLPNHIYNRKKLSKELWRNPYNKRLKKSNTFTLINIEKVDKSLQHSYNSLQLNRPKIGLKMNRGMKMIALPH